MQPFVVSARKYRPKTFQDVVGQKHIADTLMHEITQNKLAQAFLFTGPRGVGKTTCARILAKVINSSAGENADNDFAFNIFELDAASNNHVDDIRNLIDQVRIPPQIGKYKVYIIDEVHMLSTAAFNAFLKTLEEPPSYAIFILATTERHKILPTILSRCQVFNFNRIQIKDMVEHLAQIAEKETVEIENSVLHLIAGKADGGLRDALSMFDQLVSFSAGKVTYDRAVEMLGILDIDTFFGFIDGAIQANVIQTLNTVDKILNQGFDGSLILAGLADHIRNLMVSKSPETVALLDVADVFKEKYKEQTKQVDMSFLINALNLVNEADEKYKSARNPRLHIELTLIKLCHLKGFVEALPQIEELKKKIDSRAGSDVPGNSRIHSDKIIAPSIKEEAMVHTKEKVSGSRLGLLDRESFKKQKRIDEIPGQTEQETPATPLESSNQNEQSEGQLQPKTNAEQNPTQIQADEIRLALAQCFGVRIKALLKTIQAETEGHELIFLISGKAQEDALEEIRPEITQKLKEITSQSIKRFAFRQVEAIEIAKKPYTDQEKLQFLMDKYPVFTEAVEKLKLRLR